MTTDHDPPGSSDSATRPRTPPVDVSGVKVLVVDDEAVVRRGIARIVRTGGYIAEEAADGEEALRRVQAGDIQVLLADLIMPRMDGMALLRAVKRLAPTVAVIIMTGHGDVHAEVRSLRAGARDYLYKPCEPQRLMEALSTALERWRLVEGARSRAMEGGARPGLGRLTGRSAVMHQVYRDVLAAASSVEPVLIQGESGTGKELIAREIHERSGRAARPLVAVNVGNLSESMIDSELFGHVRGAFTGADRDRVGLFQTADGGTIFLDEIGDLGMSAQVRLLRTLQEGEIRRLGSNHAVRVDVRVIAATHVDLPMAVQARRFREDLYFRLDVLTVTPPPLRERRDDIPVFVHEFLDNHARKHNRPMLAVAPEALQALCDHNWPGNVRELQNTINRALVHTPGDTLTLDIVREALRADRRRTLVPGAPSDMPAMARSSVPAAVQTWSSAPPKAFSSAPPALPPSPAAAPHALILPPDGATQTAVETPAAPEGTRSWAQLAGTPEGTPGLTAADLQDAKERLTRDLERAWVKALMDATHSVAAAARLAGMDRANLRRLIARVSPSPTVDPDDGTE